MLNFIFTPQKITPKIVEVLNENINGSVEIESVELTFFSSFPRFGLKVKEGSIFPNSLFKSKDTLAIFSEARVSFNVYQYLRNDNIDIYEITLKEPNINIQVDSLGNYNFDILKTSEINEEDTDTVSSFNINNINLRKFNIENAHLLYQDGISKVSYEAEGFNTTVKAHKNNNELYLNINSTNELVSMYRVPEKRFKIRNISVDSDVTYSKVDSILKIAKTDLSINDIHFATSGTIKPEPVKKQVIVNLAATLKSNTLKNFIDLIPSTILNKKSIETQGSVNLTVNTNGIYGNGKFPKISTLLNINKGALRYEKTPGAIDDFNLELQGDFFMDNSQPSNVVVKTLNINGTGLQLNANGIGSNILHPDAVFDVSLNTDIDFTKLSQNFHIDKEITSQGNILADLKTSFKLKELKAQDYNNVNVEGKVVVNNLNINAPASGMYVKSKSLKANFDKNEDNVNPLSGSLQLEKTEMEINEKLEFSSDTLKAFVNFKKKSKNETVLNLSASINDLSYKSKKDTTFLLVRKAKVDLALLPKKDKSLSAISSNFTIDSVAVGQGKYWAGIQQGNYSFNLHQNPNKKWDIKGNVGFNNLYASFPESHLPIQMPATKLSLNNDNVTLNNAVVNYGESNATITGAVKNLEGFKNGKTVSANLKLSSTNINANELMAMFSGNNVEVEKEEKTIINDSVNLQKQAFKIPENLQFSFITDIDNIEYAGLHLEDVHGGLELKDGHLQLKKLQLKTLAANVEGNIDYEAKNNQQASLDFNLHLRQVKMNEIQNLMPVLDTLFPITKSFVGKADFSIKASSQLDKNLNFNLKTFKGVAALKARNIMVLDGPAFRDLAKTFMFKNKKEVTPIESLDLEMEFEGDKLIIYPALLEIDRYKLAVGGEQYLNLSYKYHISVLKSPVPFKTGVDISGKDFEDYSIDLSAAKYKYYFTDKERLLKKADSTIIKKKEFIRSELSLP
ncbi:AsmA-like C-terminal region-containing protein [Mesoflavibacter zeaxanthinifaciens]|uniref:AsmA-like C-terminal region-containing protein n=1 Tax=Mesoflavibacter zeaxanthinifaciens TaxID=393060 RepID=UPI003A8DDFF8